MISILVWLILAYRDLWPLATYNLQPLDAAEGWFIWTKIGILTLSATLVPLLIPRQYTPFDPEVSVKAMNNFFRNTHPCSESIG